MQNRNTYERNDHKNRIKITNGIEKYWPLNSRCARLLDFALCDRAIESHSLLNPTAL